MSFITYSLTCNHKFVHTTDTLIEFICTYIHLVKCANYTHNVNILIHTCTSVFTLAKKLAS